MTSPGPEAQSGTGEPQSGDAGTGQETGTNGETTQSGGQTQESSQTAEETVAKSEYQKALERMRAADQRAGKVEAELKQLKEKDLPEQEKLRNDLAEVSADRDKAREELKTTRLELAFFRSNKHQWQSPATALKLADLSAVTIEDDGTVRGLDAALDALAKSDAYLLKPKDGEDKDGPKGSTGAPSTGTGSTKTGLPTNMTSRIPALRTRGPRT